MFNRTIVNPFVSPPDVRVSVTQQPNDAADAARLYGECEAKAEAKVANAVIARCGARNEIVVARIDGDTNMMTRALHVRLLFTINGEKFDLRAEATPDSISYAAYQAVAEVLHGKILELLMPRVKYLGNRK